MRVLGGWRGRGAAGVVVVAAAVVGVSVASSHHAAKAAAGTPSYTIGSDGSITINGQVRPAPARPAGFTGGYRVLAIDRHTFANVSDGIYATHDRWLEQISMERKLVALADLPRQSVIVFVAPIGDPVNPTPLPQQRTLADGCVLDALPFSETCTYDPHGRSQTFTVPAQLVDGSYPPVDVMLQGGHGGASCHIHKPAFSPTVACNDESTPGGSGARVTGTLSVGRGQGALRPGGTLYVEVGGNGGDAGAFQSGAGGWNGGGQGGKAALRQHAGAAGAGGGGATDIRTLDPDAANSLGSRIVVAAAGGGAGGSSTNEYFGGGEGGAAGQPGGAPNYYAGALVGGAGTATSGGAAGIGKAEDDPEGATPGVLGTGGHGARSDSFSSVHYNKIGSAGAGGGGGGGLYGGGGGGIEDLNQGEESGGGGGGGGSSLVPAGGHVGVSAGSGFARFTFLTTTGPSLDDVFGQVQHSQVAVLPGNYRHGGK